jgi:cytochrome b
MNNSVGTDAAKTARRARVWDAPVRLTHWLLVGCVAIAWLTREAAHMDLHAAAGYCALLLVAFRVTWGFIGTKHARFGDFAYSPRQALRYLSESFRGSARHYTGHNPAGSWAVYALLALIAATVLSGIVAISGMHSLGPLPPSLSFAAAEAAREWHEILAWILVALIALHLAGVAWGSRVHRENLVASMITGRKRLQEALELEVSPRHGVAIAVLLSALLLAAQYLHASGWMLGYPDARAPENGAPANSRLEAWNHECGSCHLAYAPSLLPARSWDAMLEKQDDHFGEDLALSRETVRKLQASTHSPAPSWAAWKLAGSARSVDPPPMRITDAPFWRHAHRRLSAQEFARPPVAGRHDCEACHGDAASGIFAPRMIQNNSQHRMRESVR